jgi:hypothetical protein
VLLLSLKFSVDWDSLSGRIPGQFVILNRLQPLHAESVLTHSSRLSPSQSQSHIATDGQSACLSWCRAPSGAHDQILITV